MADVLSSSWSEIDNDNDEASPNGAPEGMAASGVNDTIRANMGAVKRMADRIMPIKTTAGTSSAYTLAYDQAASAYYDGEIISFVVNATNAAAATINVNALGAKPLRLFGGNLLAGALVTGQIAQARYSSSAGAFDIIHQSGWVRLGLAEPNGDAAVDFQNIPAAVKKIKLTGSLRVVTNNVLLQLQTYDPAGNLDTGANDYLTMSKYIDSSEVETVSVGTSAVITLGSAVSNNTGYAPNFVIECGSVQTTSRTMFNFQSAYLNQGGAIGVYRTGVGWRNEADRITGVRLFASSGNVGQSGDSVTLLASA